MSGFGFDQIHIIQSLPPGQLRAGRVLRTAILLAQPEAASHLQLRELGDKSLFRANLIAIASELQSTGRVPFLHFECHGSSDGLVLASGELVSWEELRDLLTPINVACRLNLFVSLAACHGENLATAISPVDPAPVWGLLGPRITQDVGFLGDFFRVFFIHLLQHGGLREALDAAGGGLPSAERAMVLWPADYFFVFAFRGYLAIHATSPEIAQRAKRMAALIQQEKGWPVHSRREIARDIRSSLRDHEHYFNKFLRIFLMLDRFPENEARFNLDWARFQRVNEESQYGT